MAGESAHPRRGSHQDGALLPQPDAFIERVIGTIRREAGPHAVWMTADLEVKLLEFQRYYNGDPTHAGLGGRTPEPSMCEDSARGRNRTPRASKWWRLS